jgi:hypothetical protein
MYGMKVVMIFDDGCITVADVGMERDVPAIAVMWLIHVCCY